MAPHNFKGPKNFLGINKPWGVGKEDWRKIPPPKKSIFLKGLPRPGLGIRNLEWEFF